MNTRTDPTGLMVRILAIVSLLLGLGDAMGVLAQGPGGTSAMAILGGEGFVLLAALSITRLFAAVGLWIRMQWGAVVLVASLVIELALYLSGSAWIQLSLWGFIFKTVTLLATIALLGFARVLVRRQVAD